MIDKEILKLFHKMVWLVVTRYIEAMNDEANVKFFDTLVNEERIDWNESIQWLDIDDDLYDFLLAKKYCVGEYMGHFVLANQFNLFNVQCQDFLEYYAER